MFKGEYMQENMVDDFKYWLKGMVLAQTDFSVLIKQIWSE